ncbi:MAG: hypothetical protein IJ816_02710 [Alloprevotella sp.]|nr:hypothetical protein [Alloprevotella sp.]
MKHKAIIFSLLFLCILAVLFFTRPSKSQHVEVISENITEAVNETASLDGVMEYAHEFGLDYLLKQGVKTSLSAGLQYEDYYVFTLTKLRLPKEDKVVGIGIAGHVFTADKDDIRNYIETYWP